MNKRQLPEIGLVEVGGGIVIPRRKKHPFWHGVWEFFHWDRYGNIIWQSVVENALVDMGEKDILEVYLRDIGTAPTEFYLGMANDTPSETDALSDIVGEPYGSLGAITTVTLGAGGTGYAVDNILTVVQSGASGGTVRVTSESGGVVTGISLETGGALYSVASGLATTGGGGSGATVNVTAISNGYIRKVIERSSVGWPVLVLDAGDWQMTSKLATFTANGGTIGPVNMMFLTDVVSGTSGKFIAWAALAMSKTLQDQEALGCKMRIKLK